MYQRIRPTRNIMWREMDRMQRDMSRLFEDFYPIYNRNAPSFPAMNLWADEESALITAELPGLEAKDFDLNILEDTLTISGERQSNQLPENANYHRQERSAGEFSRSLKLPYTVDTEKVKASFKEGVLEISLPRSEADRPKKIKVNLN